MTASSLRRRRLQSVIAVEWSLFDPLQTVVSRKADLRAALVFWNTEKG